MNEGVCGTWAAWRRALEIADQVVWEAPGSLGGAVFKMAHFKGSPCIESSSQRFGAGPGCGRSKQLSFKSQAHFWTLVPVRPGFREVQNGHHFKGRDSA